jgi:hypothetical protein
MPRSATSWLPRAWHEGPCGEGSGSGGDVGPRHGTVGVPTVRYGVASSSGRNCFALRGLARFYRNPMGTGLCERCALSGSWRRNAPERSPRDPAKQGSGSGGDVKTAPRICWGVCIPLRGRIFLRKRLLRPSRCAPERGPRGPAKRGSGSGGDAGDRTRTLSGRKQPATGSHLPSEETAPPFAVHSRRRLSCSPSRKAAVAPATTCSGLP